MMRRVVRSYFRLRYFPRLLVQMIETGSARQADGLRRVQEGQQRSEIRLADVHAEVASLCDDAARSMLASNSAVGELVRRTEALQRELAQTTAQVALLSRQIADALPRAQERWEDVTRGQAEADARAQETDTRVQAVEALTQAAEVQARTTAERAHEAAAAGAREVAALAEAVRRQGEDLARVERFVTQQARLFPSNIWQPEAAGRVRDTLALLAPVQAEGVGQVRVGRELDGGYVMLDDFAGIRAALSLGIADDVSWDEDIARRGIDVVQFDPSVSGPPVENERFRFQRLRVAPEDAPGAISLATAVQDLGEGSGGDLILKMDIEGSEWDVLAGCDEALLGRFRQIALEFHDLDRLGEDKFGTRAREVFARLARSHLVTHVHGNNCANFAVVGNVPVPQSLEVTFGLRSAYRAAGTPASFPTALDRPNQPGRADLYLGTFRFETGPELS